jgi:hypothetical protein
MDAQEVMTNTEETTKVTEEPIASAAEPTTNPNDQVNTDFYIVGPLKFAILFFSTLGIYMVYWFYRHWKTQKLATNESTLPVMRGIFSIFFTHELFRRIDKKLRLTEKKYDWASQSTATLVVIFNIASNILDRLSRKEIGTPYTDIAAILAMVIVGGLLFYVQKIINFACNDPLGEANNTLTGLNYLWISLGAIIIILATIGILFPEGKIN